MQKILLSILCIGIFFVSHAQFDDFLQRMEVQDSLATFHGREKIFIHYDRPQYNLNDTIWIKGYIVSGAFQMADDSSGIAYIEFLNDKGELVKRLSAFCELGLFSGTVTLSNELFSQGVYTIRAYTNRMRNFGDSLFYTSDFKIIDTNAAIWNIGLNEFSLSDSLLYISAALKTEEKEPIANSRVSVVLRSGNKVVLRKTMISDAVGNIFIDTLIKGINTTKLIQLEITNKNLSLKIPVPVTKGIPDVQFLPEGGSLIAGKIQQVGVKAVNIYGRGIPVSGIIKNSRGDSITDFSAEHKGMGIFSFNPEPGETYTAYLNDGLSYRLPKVEKEGIILQTRLNALHDSLIIKVHVSANNKGGIFFVAAAIRGVNYLKVKMQNRDVYEIKVALSSLPKGVARITVHNAAGVPLNERAVLIWHNEDGSLQMNVDAHKAAYLKKDSVSVKLKVANNTAGVIGSFSLAVIDTGMVAFKTDAENIVSYMYLTSELQGKIEEPYFYIRNPYSRETEALMLTQGWVRYNWDVEYKYPYEREFSITGRVTNVLNKPSSNTGVMLFGTNGSAGGFLLDTVTNKDGYFTFHNFPLFFQDSVSTVIKAVNKRDKSFGIGVDVFEKEYPLLPEAPLRFDMENLLRDTTIKETIDRKAAVVEQLKRDGRFLEEVIVTAVARIPGSKNLNENGEADLKITQAILDKTPKMTLLDLLIKQIPGFPFSPIMPFAIGRTPIYLILDGLELNFFELNAVDLLGYYLAEDIKGVEVMRSAKYSMPYQSKFNPTSVTVIDPPMYIEITTHGGVGPFLKKLPGMYLLKPNVPLLGKQFYSPRYQSPADEPVFPDLRQTLYWDAHVVTNEEGLATVSFYTSESKGGYLIVVQGTDLNGGFGYTTFPLKVDE